jgi:hypothetical protein
MRAHGPAQLMRPAALAPSLPAQDFSPKADVDDDTMLHKNNIALGMHRD